MKSFLLIAAVTLLSCYGFGQESAIHCAGDPVNAAESPLSSRIELKTQDGKATDLASLKGSPVILNFWATWCPPCKRELPLLAEVDRKYSEQGLKVVGVTLDEPDDPAVAHLVAEAGVKYQLLFGSLDTSFELIGAQGLPVTLYIARDGSVRHRTHGILDRQELEKSVQELLK